MRMDGVEPRFLPQRGLRRFSPALPAVGGLRWVECGAKHFYPNGVAPLGAAADATPLG